MAQVEKGVLKISAAYFEQNLLVADTSRMELERAGQLNQIAADVARMDSERAANAEEFRQKQIEIAGLAGEYLRGLREETDLMQANARERQHILDMRYLEFIGMKEGVAGWEAMRTKIGQVRDAQERLNGSWVFGTKRAMIDYLDSIRNVAESVENIWAKAFSGLEDALIQFIRTGEASFSDLANSIIDDLLRILIQMQVTWPLAQMIGGFAGNIGMLGMGASAGATPLQMGMGGQNFAQGGSFVVEGSGGIDSSLVKFMATPGERVTVENESQQMRRAVPNVTINLVNETGQNVEIEETSPPRFDGESFVVSALIRRMSRDGRAREQMRQLLSGPRA
jgi:lambda family phage tail tape measure protein